MASFTTTRSSITDSEYRWDSDGILSRLLLHIRTGLFDSGTRFLHGFAGLFNGLPCSVLRHRSRFFNRFDCLSATLVATSRALTLEQ
jgi:hypothetical protein